MCVCTVEPSMHVALSIDWGSQAIAFHTTSNIYMLNFSSQYSLGCSCSENNREPDSQKIQHDSNKLEENSSERTRLLMISSSTMAFSHVRITLRCSAKPATCAREGSCAVGPSCNTLCREHRKPTSISQQIRTARSRNVHWKSLSHPTTMNRVRQVKNTVAWAI